MTMIMKFEIQLRLQLTTFLHKIEIYPILSFGPQAIVQ